MKIMTVGTGGYATVYINALLANTDPSIEYVGAVEKYPDTSPTIEALSQAGIPVYSTMEEFFSHHTADLTIISTPTFLHREQSICALAHGSYVLCEKPSATTVDDAQAMMDAEKQYEKFIAIGFQFSYNHGVRELKQEILNGVFGKPLSLRTILCSPRDYAYYARGGGWGGRISKDGHLLLDSVASNACAHYVQNMLFVLGKTMEESALPVRVEAECLRGNAIENFDTCILRMETEDKVPVYFTASHATKDFRSLEFEYEFEKAVIRFAPGKGLSKITAFFHNGSEKTYGNLFGDETRKMFDSIEAIQNGTTPICTVKTAFPHTQIIYSLYKNAEITDFPDSMKRETPEKNQLYIEGLTEMMIQAYEERKLFSEMGYSFTKPTDYRLG